MRYFLLIVFIGYLLLFVSCKKYQPAPEAFFMVADNVAVSTTTAQGSGSHKISDLFLYVNGKFEGAYPVGNTMPIVSRGANAKVDIFAGIKNNGFQDLSVTWQLYDRITFDTVFPSGTNIKLPLTFKYNSNVTFLWHENFDNPVGFSLIKSANTGTTFTATTNNSFEGKSAELALTGNSYDEARLESAIFYNIPQGNANVYLELDYRCTQDFEVGVTNGITLKTALVIRAKENWNKIYIQLASAVNTPPLTNSSKVYFRLIKPNDVPDARVWLDNIKLIYL